PTRTGCSSRWRRAARRGSPRRGSGAPRTCGRGSSTTYRARRTSTGCWRRSGACPRKRRLRAERRLRRMSTGKKWLFRFFLLAFIPVGTIGVWLPPIITHAVEKDYYFPEVDIDATVLPNGDLLLEETRTFDFQNGPFTYAYFNVDDPLDHVRDFAIAERLGDGTEVPVTPDDAYHSAATEGFQSRWSYSAEDETRTWVFRYRVACVVDVYSDTAHLYWQFIGSGWDKPTQHAVITVHVPGSTAGQIGL